MSISIAFGAIRSERERKLSGTKVPVTVVCNFTYSCRVATKISRDFVCKQRDCYY